MLKLAQRVSVYLKLSLYLAHCTHRGGKGLFIFVLIVSQK